MLFNFIKEDWTSILTVIVIIVILILLYKHNNKNIVKKIILGLVVKAEKALGSGTGELKYALVINEIYERLPIILRLLFSKSDIDCMIEDSVSKLKELLISDKVNLLGYDDETLFKKLE